MRRFLGIIADPRSEAVRVLATLAVFAVGYYVYRMSGYFVY
ncbi:MAG: hypothetical protein RMK01_10940 [Thermomicrobium sp.]|nr:hypothetical protein [Thermomicrobium sp.]